MRDDERCKEDARLITFNTLFQVSFFHIVENLEKLIEI